MNEVTFLYVECFFLYFGKNSISLFTLNFIVRWFDNCVFELIKFLELGKLYSDSCYLKGERKTLIFKISLNCCSDHLKNGEELCIRVF